MTKLTPIPFPIIDIFAGPGGLGEGFSAYNGGKDFTIKLSIEKDEIAHRTLELRSFLRSFGYGKFPDEYYQYITGDDVTKEQLFELYPDNARKASHEAWQVELGAQSSETVHERIRLALGNKKHWVLLGGPPCQAYSLVGRARMTGLGVKGRELDEAGLKKLRKEKLKDFYEDHRHTLYKEYLKIVAVHKPTIFVMENVKGILSSKQGENLIFEKILSDLQDPWAAIEDDSELSADTALSARRPSRKPKYRLFSFVTGKEPGKRPKLDPREFIIRAEEYGIPQRRHRVIILGILEGYEVEPKSLQPVLIPVKVKEALDSLPKIRSGLSKHQDSPDLWRKIISKGFPASAIERMNKEIASEINKAIKALGSLDSRGGRAVKYGAQPEKSDFFKWISDPLLRYATLHETRGHMDADLWRYLYAACYADVKGHSPTIDKFPTRLLPDHQNIPKDRQDHKTEEIHFKDRFKVQVAYEPATTITSHISKDGHYYIHYDPAQCRSLTVREAARLQTFPDNYFFEGNRTQQYHQIGNAVPPLLANKLAYVVADVMAQCLKMDNAEEEKKTVRKLRKIRA